VGAVLLVDRHLVFLQVVIGDALLQNTDQQIVGELVLVGELRRRNGLDAGEVIAVGFVALSDGGEGIVGQLVVIAVIAESGGAFGEVAQFVFVVVVKKGVLRGESFRQRSGALGKARTGGREQNDEQYGCAHETESNKTNKSDGRKKKTRVASTY